MLVQAERAARIRGEGGDLRQGSHGCAGHGRKLRGDDADPGRSRGHSERWQLGSVHRQRRCGPRRSAELPRAPMPHPNPERRGVRWHRLPPSRAALLRWRGGLAERKFEDGYANALHVFGLCANIRGAVFRNNYPWTIGAAPWGGQSNIQVDEFAVYLRAPSATITQANINSLSNNVGTPAPLAHHIWGQREVNRSSFASLQAAATMSRGLAVVRSWSTAGPRPARRRPTTRASSSRATFVSRRTPRTPATRRSTATAPARRPLCPR